MVILVTHEPNWLLDWYWISSTGRNVNHLIQDHLKGRCRIRLAGDLHHYMHHSVLPGTPGSVEHLIVNGSGGAFLHPTHVFAGFSQFQGASYETRAAYPSFKESRRVWWHTHTSSLQQCIHLIFLRFFPFPGFTSSSCSLCCLFILGTAPECAHSIMWHQQLLGVISSPEVCWNGFCWSSFVAIVFADCMGEHLGVSQEELAIWCHRRCGVLCIGVLNVSTGGASYPVCLQNTESKCSHKTQVFGLGFLGLGVVNASSWWSS